MKIAITGETGFVGKELIKKVDSKSWSINSAVRKLDGKYIESSKIRRYKINGVDKDQLWDEMLEDVDVVIHCAGLSLLGTEESLSPFEKFREVNTLGTLQLAKQAVKAGVKRFIFISSIKVNGEFTDDDSPFTFNKPSDPYGLSKYEAEIGLNKIANETGMEIVIIRPPLVYGSEVKANFKTMFSLVSKGLPLPLSGIKDNKRSLVYVGNLVDLIITCIEHPSAVNQTFLVSDNYDVSTSQLLSTIAKYLEVPNRMFPFPVSIMKLVAKITGKEGLSFTGTAKVFDREPAANAGILHVDITHTQNSLEWIPPFTFDEGIKITTEAFVKKNLK